MKVGVRMNSKAQAPGQSSLPAKSEPDDAPTAPFKLPSGYAAYYGLEGSVQRKAVGRIQTDPDAAFRAGTNGPGGEVPYRAEMEHAFGQSFGGVRAYHDSAGLESIGAQAAARDEKVAFDSASPSKELVAHELTHIVQQRQSPASGAQQKSSVSDSGEAAEREADQVAARVTRGEQVTVHETPPAALPLARGKMRKAKTFNGTELKEGDEVEVIADDKFMVSIKVNGKEERIPGYEIVITDRTGLDGPSKPVPSSVSSTTIVREETKTPEKKEPPVEGAEPNPGSSFSYRGVHNPLFGPNGPKPEDAVQGAIGDCFFIAALDALARTEIGRRHIIEMIHMTDDGRAFSVVLYAQASEKKE
jgi:hypothetical protein